MTERIKATSVKVAQTAGRPVRYLPSAQTSKEGAARARTLDRAGIGYRKQENCFVWVEDVKRAQRLFDGQLRTAWPKRLDVIASGRWRRQGPGPMYGLPGLRATDDRITRTSLRARQDLAAHEE